MKIINIKWELSSFVTWSGRFMLAMAIWHWKIKTGKQVRIEKWPSGLQSSELTREHWLALLLALILQLFYWQGHNCHLSEWATRSDENGLIVQRSTGGDGCTKIYIIGIRKLFRKLPHFGGVTSELKVLTVISVISVLFCLFIFML